MSDTPLSDAIRNLLERGCNHDDVRTNRSIKNCLLDAITSRKDIIGHNTTSDEAVDYERQLIILESKDETFANALEVIANTVLEISPIKPKKTKEESAAFPWVGNPS